MAKAAKEVASDNGATNPRVVNKFLKDILARFEAMETARGKYMNLCRRERESMQSIYEVAAQQHGIAQKSAKTYVRIHRLLAKATGLLNDLEIEERRIAQQMAKAAADKKQLMLFGDLPKAEKPPKAAKPPKAEEKSPKFAVVGESSAA